MNTWISSKNARIIIEELQIQFSGTKSTIFIEHTVLKRFYNHKLYDKNMFLKIHKDNLNCFLWFQIGIFIGFSPNQNCFILVPE